MKKVLIALLNQYDALLCEGKMASELAGLNGIDKPIRKVTYLGVPKERMIKLQEVKPNLKSNHFIFIASGPKGWRTHYKGLDLMLDAYQLAFEKCKDLKFTIIGEWDIALQENLCRSMSNECKESIHFVGKQNKIEEFLKDACFYFHVSRGDAFPTVVLEAMSAGLIPIVSKWTGSKEVCEKVDSSLILELDKNEISKKIEELSKYSLHQRESLSSLSRSVSSTFTEEFALSNYKATFEELKEELSKQ
jgi:glycosyltransferase involved in cell wall biosynthesis